MEKLIDRVRGCLKGTTQEWPIALEDIAKAVGCTPRQAKGALLGLQDKYIARFAHGVRCGYYLGPGDADW
jgi:hypothetical protein